MPASDRVLAPFLQRIENAEPKSKSKPAKTSFGRARVRKNGAPAAANFAGRNAAIAWRTRYLEWMETPLPRTSTDLLGRLPFADALKLAALAGTKRMTWPEINAALDAMIKLAAAETLVGAAAEERRAAPAPRTARQVAEDEIWARYHAECDEVFAKDAGPTSSAKELWRTERILDRLRNARNRELAALRRHPDDQPSGAALSMATVVPSQTTQSWTELSSAERAALSKLSASGFTASEGMIEAIDSLVSEIVVGQPSDV